MASASQLVLSFVGDAKTETFLAGGRFGLWFFAAWTLLSDGEISNHCLIVGQLTKETRDAVYDFTVLACTGGRMIKKRTVKVIERQELDTRERHVEDESSGGSNIWSQSVRVWVDQYRQASSQRPPAFDRLFKDSQPAEHPVGISD